jgi:hypothetical protein
MKNIIFEINYSAILNFQEKIISIKGLFLPKINNKEIKMKNYHF